MAPADPHKEDSKPRAGETARRVKVYLLQGEDWLDNGTGYCVGDIEDSSQIPYFLVRNELDSEDIILKSFLKGSTQYQRQQETLIVWTDSSGKDLALSFQETAGCADLCEFIIRVQQENYSPDISLYYVIPNISDGDDITELITGPITYPEDPTIDNLESILDLVTKSSNSQYTRGCVSNHVIETGFFNKLIAVFEQAEALKSLPALYTLSEILKTLILFNEASLIDDFLSTEDKIIGLVGILEYDPEYPNFKACHRDYLKNKSFKTVIPVEKLSIFKKDFHFNFLKDVVLARFLDDQTFNLISSLIYVNQVEIINYLKDSEILAELFKIYEQDDDSEEKLALKRDGVRMLHQYVLIAKCLQSYQKSEFFAQLVKSGLFGMINFALKDSDNKIRVFGTELIVIIIEQDVSLVNAIDNEDAIDNCDPPSNHIEQDKDDTIVENRNFKLKLSDDMTLISILTKLLVEDENPGLKIQAFEALRILLDSNIAANTSPSAVTAITTTSPNNDSFDSRNGDYTNGTLMIDEFNDINTNNYFQAFYSQVAPQLFQGIIELASMESSQIDSKVSLQGRSTVLLYQQLCELISFCTKEHEVHISRPFFLENHILLGLAKLLETKCKVTLKLSIIRCLKNLILLNDTFYCRYIINHGILDYFFSFYESIVDQNNLINSSCLDLLEIVLRNCDSNARQNFKLIASYIHKHYRDFCVGRIQVVNTGRELVDMVENGFYEETRGNTFAQDSEHSTSTPVEQTSVGFTDMEENIEPTETSTEEASVPGALPTSPIRGNAANGSDLAYTTNPAIEEDKCETKEPEKPVANGPEPNVNGHVQGTKREKLESSTEESEASSNDQPQLSSNGSLESIPSDE